MLKAEPVLRVREDPDLLGGMVVRVGAKVFDGSVRSRLETLRNQLLSRGSHEIQAGRDRFSHPG
jgi:F0F1-type ATP synthase delta subunit